jgi:hypothetical protein
VVFAGRSHPLVPRRTLPVGLSSTARQQCAHDSRPLIGEPAAGRAPTGASVPIGGIALVALFTVQVGVDPGTARAFILLRRFVRSHPIALSIPPQPSQRKVQVSGRSLAAKRVLEQIDIHTQ